MSFWKDKPVLITGAGGFFGGWLMRKLIAREARVIALVRRENPQSQFAIGGFARQVIVERGDVSEQSVVEGILDRHGEEEVFHTALAGGDVQANLADPVPCILNSM